MVFDEVDDIGEDPRLTELEDLRQLVNSTDWRRFSDLLVARKDNLERQALVDITSRKFDDAYRKQAKAEECGKIVGLVTDRIKSLRESLKTKGDE